MDGAVAAARANGDRNGVEVDWRSGDLEREPVPLAAMVLVNAPPPVQARVAAALPGRDDVRHVIVSGVVPEELERVTAGYAAAGWAVAEERLEDGWAAARLEPAGA
jgi:hypothetical protein